MFETDLPLLVAGLLVASAHGQPALDSARVAYKSGDYPHAVELIKQLSEAGIGGMFKRRTGYR
jgi:hypothetical protein